MRQETYLNRKLADRRPINNSKVGISSEGLKRAIISMLNNLVENMDKRYEQMENFSKKLKL